MAGGYTEKSFAMNLTLMRFIGIYPVNKHEKWSRVYGIIVYLTILVPFPILGFLHLCFKEDIDMLELSYNGFVVVDTACFILKYIPFLKNPERIRKCVQYLDSVKFLELRENQRGIIDKCAQICKRNTKVFLIGCVASIINCCTKPLYSETQFLPILIWLPFNWLKNPVVYYAAYIYISLGVLYCGCSTGPVDPLIGGLACHASGQLRILKDNLQHLQQYARDQKNKENGNTNEDENIYYMIKQCIEHHKAIYQFYKEYEECFSLTVFSQFLASSVIFGFCCLYLSKLSLLSANFLTMMVYFYVTVFQIYFYCYYGTSLIDESNTLNTAIYMGNWYDYSVKSQKALTIFMENSKKPMVVTAGKIFDLSLDTFATIIKRSYSILALLKNY